MSEGRCPVCGAPRVGGAACACCKTGASAFSLGGLADVARRDAAALDALLPTLASALEQALPGQVQVDRGGGPFRRGGAVRRIVATIGAEAHQYPTPGVVVTLDQRS